MSCHRVRRNALFDGPGFPAIRGTEIGRSDALTSSKTVQIRRRPDRWYQHQVRSRSVSRSSFSRQARTLFCSVLVMGSLLLGREGSQNVTLVLGLHTKIIGRGDRI